MSLRYLQETLLPRTDRATLCVSRILANCHKTVGTGRTANPCTTHRSNTVGALRTFKCSLDHAKRSFYRAVNGIFGRIGRMASEEVILIKTKCLPILLYGLEVCPLSKTNLRSPDFPINRFIIKLFNTNDVQTTTKCQSIFDFRFPSVIIIFRIGAKHF